MRNQQLIEFLETLKESHFIYYAQLAVICLLIIVGISGGTAKAQVQNTGYTYVSSGTTMYVQSGFVNASTASYQNNGSIYVTGDFTNNQSAMAAGTGSIFFTGSALQYITGTQPSVFYHATVNNSNGIVMNNSVTVSGTATLTSGNLSINGNTLTLNGATSFTGALKGSTTSKLTIGGTGGGSAGIKFNAAAGDSMLHTLTLNRTGASAGLTLNSNVGIINYLDISNGVFSVNDKIVTLKSTSIANTAQVGPVGGSINHGTSGTFTVERYIPLTSGNRSYRDVASGVKTTSSIFNNYQENGGTAPNLGTHITGIAGVAGIDATTGFDRTQTAQYSMYQYLNGAFVTVPNTKSTTLDPIQGFHLFIRGDRTVNMYVNSNIMAQPTTLRANGTLVTGDVTINTSGTTGGVTSTYKLNASASGYSLIGNPYASAVEWSKLTKTNLSGTYWIWDPTTGTRGGYVTWNGTTNSFPAGSAVNGYIQPGQAFFVLNTGSGSSLGFKESYKAAYGVPLTAVFDADPKAPVSKMSICLSKEVAGTGNVKMDGAVALFAPDYSNTVFINQEDAGKFSNSTENVIIRRDGNNMSIEARKPAIANDSLPLRLTNVTTATDYTLSVNTTEFTPVGVQGFVKDNFLKTQRALKAYDTTNVAFTITADTNSYINRFTIVFNPSATVLPVNSIAVKASQKNQGIQVEWNTIGETNLLNHEVQRSANGQQFDKAATVAALNTPTAAYNWFDASPLTGDNYYRIKAVDANGQAQYSNIAVVKNGAAKRQISFYPNPVTGNAITLQLTNVDKGSYTMLLYNAAGQQVFTKEINHAGGSATQPVQWNNNLPAGNYAIKIIAADRTVVYDNMLVKK